MPAAIQVAHELRHGARDEVPLEVGPVIAGDVEVCIEDAVVGAGRCGAECRGTHLEELAAVE